MSLAIIIVNYRTPELVNNCLKSLSGERESRDFVVVIVDNNSNDDSVPTLRNFIEKYQYNGWVELIPLSENGGFSAGNNAAIRQLFSREDNPFDYFMLLNPDTLCKPGSITHLIDFLEDNQKVGIVGAQLENEDQSLESCTRRFPSPISEFESAVRLGLISKILSQYKVTQPIVSHPHESEWVSGAAMMIRKEVFEQIGYLDEEFFLYFEEVDFCKRTRKAGWQIWLEPRSVIVHLEGSSTGKREKRKRRGYYWYDSRRRYFIKHHGLFIWLVSDICWYVGRLLFVMREFLKLGGDSSNDPLFFTRDLIVGDILALFNGSAWKINKKPLKR